MTTCWLCRLPIEETARGNYVGQFGFARDRIAGGLHALALRREVPGIVAHSWCVEKERHGIDAAQTELFPLDAIEATR